MPAAPLLLVLALAPAVTPWRSFQVRRELPTTGMPVGVAALPGAAGVALVATTRSPGQIVVWDSPAEAVSEGRPALTVPCGDFPLLPLRWDDGGSARLAVISQATREVVVHDRESLARGEALQRIALAQVPRTACVLGDGTLCIFTRTNEILLVGRSGTIETTYAENDQICVATPLAGRAEIVVGSQVERRIAIYARDEERPSGWRQLLQFPFEGIPRAIAESDVDGDGDLELSIAGGDGALWTLGGGAAGGAAAWLEQDPLRPLRTASGVVPIDLAANGELHALSFTDQALLQLGAPEDGALRVLARTYAGQRPVDMCLADLDGDGDGETDVAAANRDARCVSLWLSATRPSLRVESVAVGRGPSALAAADLNGDGREEVAVLESLAGSLSLLSTTATGTPSVVRLADAAEATDVAFAELTGDRTLDLVLLRTLAADRAVLAIAAGTQAPAGFGPFTEIPAGKSSGNLCVADLDADGRDELYVSDPASDEVAVFAPAPGGGLPREIARLVVPSGPRALAAGKVAGGGTALFVALAGPGTRKGIAVLALRLSESAAGDQPSLVEVAHVAVAGTPLDLALVDLDGAEGDELCVLGHDGPRDGPGMLRVLAHSNGTWREWSLAATGARAAAVVPFAGGLAVSAQNSHHVGWWRATAEGLRALPALGVGTGPLGLVRADLDGDGERELVCANGFSDDVSILGVR